MENRDPESILNAVQVSLDHPLFFQRVFTLLDKQQQAEIKQLDPLGQIIREEYEELSRNLDRSIVQESCSVRNVLRTRRLALLLIDEKGEIDSVLLKQAVEKFRAHLYSLGPERQHDRPRQVHILKVLELLNGRKELVLELKKFVRPLSNPWAEDLIRYTLQLPPATAITDAHTRQAVLSAWLCYLRQNVGSCFATAPAEIIHDEQPEQFLKDMLELIATGRLKRTFGGVENSVPLSASWGNGDLKKPLVVTPSAEGITPEVGYSPGLIAAFETMGLLKREASYKHKSHYLEGWIKSIMGQSHSLYTVLTAEMIMRKVLLQILNLSDEQLKEYESRPPSIVSKQFLVAPTTKNPRSMGERCAYFHQVFERGKNRFKSFGDNALLKAWEFTLASFCDTKHEFTHWNLYASLGLQTNEPGGIGQAIYKNIQHKLDMANRKAQEMQYEYEIVYTQVKTLEARMKHAASEKDAQWLRVEYQTHANEFYFLQEQRDEAQNRAAQLVNLYDQLYKIYLELFKDYFQEVYDAEMQEVASNLFDDSPAGFRLLYKHGRSNPSQWTLIKNQNDYIDALASFFVATEPHIAHLLEDKKIERDLSEVVTAIISHVRTREFLESAFHRMAIAHKVMPIQNPLDHIEQIEKKPWVYTSGGTMNTLVSSYYRLEENPKEVEKWVENEMELLVFFADTLKQIPHGLLHPFLTGQKSALLMQSPTHAFLLKPNLYPFLEAWTNEEYTYTYIRDRFIRPAEFFIQRLLLDDAMLDYLSTQLMEKIPENYKPRFKNVLSRLEGPLNPMFFRDHLVDMLSTDRGLKYGNRPVLSEDEIDSFLYSSLPLFSIADLKERVKKILSALPGLDDNSIHSMLNIVDQMPYSVASSIMSAQHLQGICKALICLTRAKTSFPVDYHAEIALAAQKLGLAMPTPLIFADTNWVKDMFGFVVNPGTGKLELWRVDANGTQGYPMSMWKPWVNGSRSDLKWGLYVKPYQYGQS